MSDDPNSAIAKIESEYSALPKTETILGMNLNPIASTALLDLFRKKIFKREQILVSYQNLHGMRLNYIDERLSQLHKRTNSLVFVDGFPIYVLCKVLRRPINRNQRITGNDFIWPLLRLADQSGWRVYFLGSKDEILAAASTVIRRNVPGLVFRTHDGYFDTTVEGDTVLEDIRIFAPNLIIVCMGMPRQEHWIQENADSLRPASICAMGAIMSYISGSQRVPPRWLGPIGLEWLFRLLENPRHVWHRYLVEPWLLLGNILMFVSKRR